MNSRSPRLLGAALALAGLATAITGHAMAPAARYTATNGTTYDTKTKLTWEQTLSTTATFTEANAAAHCAALTTNGLKWRLPTMKELMTIVDPTVASGASIDSTAFPATPANGFWTSTAFAPSSGYNWAVTFYEGQSYGSDVTGTLNVRCVH
jgi:Protein of unknown function (DUF1566)